MLSGRVVPLSDLFKLTALRPPSVQRSYEWQKAEAEPLLTDIMRGWAPPAESALETVDAIAEAERAGDAAAEEALADASMPDLSEAVAPAAQRSGPYYLGEIVINVTSPGEADIFDGLQRTTTLVILFSLMRDLIADIEVTDALNAHINRPNGQPKRTLGRTHGWLEQDIQAPGTAAQQRQTGRYKPGPQRAAMEIAALFRERLQDLSTSQLRAFADYVFSNVKVCLLMCEDIRVARARRIGRIDESDLLCSRNRRAGVGNRKGPRQDKRSVSSRSKAGLL